MRQIDNLIILDFGLAPDAPLGSVVSDFLCPYRRLVNPNLLYVSIDASAGRCQYVVTVLGFDWRLKYALYMLLFWVDFGSYSLKTTTFFPDLTGNIIFDFLT